MVNVPSMTPEQAEAELGPRGTLEVNRFNRGAVKKWLVARGYPAGFVGGLSYIEMQNAYNRTSGEGLAQLDKKLATAREDLGGAVDASEAETAVPAVPTAVAVPPTNGAAHDKAQQLLDLLRSLGGVDRGLVESIVADKLAVLQSDLAATLPDLIAVHAPVKTIEVRNVDTGVTNNVGLTHKSFPELLACIAANVPVMMVGPAGSGKTMAFEQACAALDIPFRMNGATTGAHEYLGYKDAHGNYHVTPYRQSYEHGGGYLADELDGSDPAAPLVINAGIANGSQAFPDSADPIKRHDGFRIAAATNTYGNGADRQYVGRNQLDASTTDRFAVIDWDYDEDLERAVCANVDWAARCHAVRAAMRRLDVRHIVSFRAIVNGAKLLAAGLSQDKVERMTIWKGLPADTRARVEGAL